MSAIPKLEAYAPPQDRKRWIALSVLMSAVFLGLLDVQIVNLSLSSIKENLGANFAEIQLVVGVYALAYAVGVITGGRLGDIYGRKKMFIIGVGCFSFFSALCGLAPTPIFLLTARGLQGLSAAVMYPQVLAMIRVMFPLDERPKAFGWLGATMGLASIAGPLLGGVILGANFFDLSWRPIFLVNTPIGALAVAMASRLVPESKADKVPTLDLVGVGLVSVGLFCIVLPLVLGRQFEWPWWCWVSSAVGFPTLAIFGIYEMRCLRLGRTPLLDFKLFHYSGFSRGLIVALIYFTAVAPLVVILAMVAQLGLGMSTMGAALLYLPFSVSYILASQFSVPMLRKMGAKTLQVGIGLMILATGILIFLFSHWQEGTTPWWLVAPLLVYGMGQGLVTSPLLNLIISFIPAEDAGIASGIITTTQQIGYSLGVALVGGVYFALVGHAVEGRAYIHAFQPTFLLNSGLLAVTFTLIFFLARATKRVT